MSVGWETKPLVTLCEVFADGDWIETKDQSPDGIRLIQTGNVGDGEFKSRDGKARYVSEKTFARLKCTEVFPGDCLISRLPDPVGRSCILPETGDRMITAVDCTIVRFSQGRVLPEFFNYYAQSHKYLRAVDTECTGTTRNRISRAKLGQVSVPVPPLPEQRRIVTILDEALEGIAAAKANAEKNLRNAREVFESHRDTTFLALRQQEDCRPLEELVEEIATGPFGSLLHKSDYEVGGTPLVNPINIEEESIVADERKAVGLVTAKRLARYRLRAGDVAVGRRGDIGRCAVVAAEQAGWLCGTGCFVVRTGKAIVPDFLAHLLRSSPYRKQLIAKAGRATMPSISNQDLARLPVPAIEPDRQRQALDGFAELSDHCTELAEGISRKLAALDELKSSLLHQAFTGQL